MTKYDENLVDQTDKIIARYNELKKFLYTALTVSIVIMVTQLCVIINITKHPKIIIEKEYILQEEPYSLESAIGFYTLNNIKDTVDDCLLYLFLQENGAYYPELLVKQAKLETACYTSNIYSQYNNLYGMNKATIRQSTQINQYTDNTKYGKYLNWRLSALDRILWDKYMFPEKPEYNEYINTVALYYAEDPEYINKINNINVYFTKNNNYDSI